MSSSWLVATAIPAERASLLESPLENYQTIICIKLRFNFKFLILESQKDF
jgi:hypothetical protein